MKQARILQITGILLLIRGVTFAYVALQMTDILWPLCCPYCPAPGVWDFYWEISRNLSSMELELWPYMILLFLLGAILSLIAGIMGILYWQNPKRGNRCFLWGITVATVYPFLLWWGATSVVNHPRAFWFVRLEVGIGFLLVYVFYIIGAYSLKKAWRITDSSV